MSNEYRMRWAVLILFCLCGCEQPRESGDMLNGNTGMLEWDLISRIHRADNVGERQSLIEELESTPVERIPFHSRWIQVHEVRCSECWSNNGFDSSQADLPENVQLLLAMYYSRSQINNGGLHQLLFNPGGVMAPEMQIWTVKAGLSELSADLRVNIAILGEPFPRSQAARWERLKQIATSTEMGMHPFMEFDSRFYALKNQINTAADTWLRQECGVVSLKTDPKSLPRR